MTPLEQNVRVRPALRSDARDLSRICRSSWRYAYTGIIPHRHLARTLDQRTERWWRKNLSSRAGGYLLLEVLEQPAGYASLGYARHHGGHEGEIYELYLEPTYQGLGFGEVLFESCRMSLDQAKIRGLMVWVLKDNETAREFYRRRGGTPRTKRIDHSTGARLEKVSYVWE
ncbi:MAG: GNAT family N-acetyltransferase [Filomicrobium sp.]